MEVMGQEVSEDLQHQLKYLGISFALIVVFIAGHNVLTPNQGQSVGYTEINIECRGLNVGGVCLGLKTQDHTTYNYNNYTEVEKGTENYYRRVEAELMMQAYNICDEDMSGMEWTDKASYDNQTATKWMQNENVSLLPCDRTFYRSLPENSS